MYCKLLFYFSFLCLALTACGTSKQAACVSKPTLMGINIIDRNGLTEMINTPERLCMYENVDFLQPQPYQKVLRIYSRDVQGNIPSCITSYHPNGNPSRYLEVVSSRACGAYQEWHPNGNKKVFANVIEGMADIHDGAEKTWVFDGCCQAWNENGQLEATIPYYKGDLEGISTYYHPNGNIWKTIPYHQNRVEGTAETYRSDGTLLQTICYCNGLKEGSSRRYWEEDQLAAEEVYCEGLLSFGRYYDPKGDCIAQIDDGNGVKAVFGKEAVIELQEYRYGLLEGEVKVLDKYGRVINLYHAKNNCKHGEEICFYDAPRLQKTLTPKLSINWFEGKIQGTVKTWYDSGVQESQREMSNNKRNGHSTAWYRDGSLMLIEEYEQDRLKKGEYFAKNEKFPISTVEDGKGVATLFDAEGSLVQKINYHNGKPRVDD